MPTSTPAPPRPPRVVVVDDDPAIRTALAELLGDCGIDVVGTAADGQAGLELVAEQRPDVVLMDLRMPRLDGAEATERIRAGDETVQVVLLSAYDDPALMIGAKHRGAYAYLVKGCPGSLVVDVVMQAYALAAGLRGRRPEAIRVVIADDVEVVREGLAELLDALDSGFSVVGTAANGPDAVRLAVELNPDVLVVDLRMPGLDGITVAIHVGALAPHVAVVLHSGHTDAEFVEDARRAGAFGFLPKGSPAADIVQVLRDAVRARRAEPDRSDGGVLGGEGLETGDLLGVQ